MVAPITPIPRGTELCPHCGMPIGDVVTLETKKYPYCHGDIIVTEKEIKTK